jgi:hypothetical protein
MIEFGQKLLTGRTDSNGAFAIYTIGIYHPTVIPVITHLNTPPDKNFSHYIRPISPEKCFRLLSILLKKCKPLNIILDLE